MAGSVSLKRFLDVAIAVLIGILVVQFARWQRLGQESAPTLQPYQVGDSLMPVSANVSDSPVIALVLISSCSYCTDSMPFYRTLRTRTAGQLPLLVLTPEPQTKMNEYLASNQLKVDAVTTVDWRELKVRGTPTMFMLDRSGTIRRLYSGRLSPLRQAEALREIDELVRTK